MERSCRGWIGGEVRPFPYFSSTVLLVLSREMCNTDSKDREKYRGWFVIEVILSSKKNIGEGGPVDILFVDTLCDEIVR